ncbi:MAG: hypothetical protein ONB05_04805 [candidate division KSB1 bacterium]|nr:hypothetical protein [candidate division KSB1 bacterium]
MELVSIGILDIALVFLILLAVASIIERVIEFLTVVMDFLEPYIGLDQLWKRLGERIQRKFAKRLEEAAQKGKTEMTMVLNVIKGVLFRPDLPAGFPATVRVDLIRKIILMTSLQIVGIIVGIFLCSKAHLNAFELLKQLGVATIKVSKTLGIIITGILVGFGTGPIHAMIKFAEDKKERQKIRAAVAKLRQAGIK